MAFVKEFNDRTKDQEGLIIPAVITIYQDRSFSFVTKTPPASVLLKRAAGLEKGSARAGSQRVGRVTRKQLREIAELKRPDLNASSLEAAERLIEGTARSMGIEVVD